MNLKLKPAAIKPFENVFHHTHVLSYFAGFKEIKGRLGTVAFHFIV